MRIRSLALLFSGFVAGAASAQTHSFSSVLVEGNSRFSAREILVTAGLDPTAPISRADVLRAVSDLDGTGEFRSVTVQPRGNDLVIIVDEEPAYAGELNFGIGYDSVSGPILSAQANLGGFGDGRTDLSAGLSFARLERSARFDVARRPADGGKLSYGFRLSYQDLKDPSSIFTYARMEATPYLNYAITDRAAVELRYSLLREEIGNVSGAASPVIAADAGRYDASVLGLSGRIKSAPGGRFSWGLNVDQDFLRGVNGGRVLSRSAIEARGQVALPGDFAVRGSLEAAAVRGLDGTKPLATDRFLLGGAGLRGFAPGGVTPRDDANDGALGADSYAVLRGEFVFPTIRNWDAIETFAFYDAGKMWGMTANGAPAGAIEGMSELRQSYGFGISANTQVGKLEAYVALGSMGAPNDRKQNFGLAFRSDF